MNRFATAAFAAFSSFNTYAQSAPEPLQVEAEIGVLLTSGNTESTALSSRVNVKQDLRDWRNNYIAEGLYKEDEVEVISDGEAFDQSRVTAERYFLSAQTDYKLGEQYKGLFLFGSYEEDTFSGYDYQASLAAGYSDRLFDTPQAYFEYSIGPGYTVNRTAETRNSNGDFSDNQREESAIVRLSGFYQYDFSDNAKFTQSLASDAAFESGVNTRSKAVSAVTANLNDSFALKASLTVTHNTEVPELLEKTDTTTAITLVYSFN